MRHLTQKLQHWWSTRQGDSEDGDGIHVGTLLEKRALASVFQPLVDLHSGAVVGHEALLRAPRSEGEHSFDSLLGAAKVEHCQRQLEMAGVDCAIERWQHARGKGKLFVNISAQALVQLHESDAMDSVLQLLRKHKLQATRMGLEITGYSRLPRIETLVDALRPLRTAGVLIALDDFKASDSSMRVWAKVLPSVVKLAPRWTRNIDHDTEQQRAVGSLVRLTRNHDSLLVAKSVESEAELHALRQLGVDWAQGYFLGSPAPDLVTTLNRRAQVALSAAIH